MGGGGGPLICIIRYANDTAGGDLERWPRQRRPTGVSQSTFARSGPFSHSNRAARDALFLKTKAPLNAPAADAGAAIPSARFPPFYDAERFSLGAASFAWRAVNNKKKQQKTT